MEERRENSPHPPPFKEAKEKVDEEEGRGGRNGSGSDDDDDDATDRALLSLGLDPELVQDTRPVSFDPISESMLRTLDARRCAAAEQEAYEEAQLHHDAYQECMVAATALQALGETYQAAMAAEDFDRAADLKAKAIEIRRDQEKAFDPVAFERTQRQQDLWRQSFGGEDANADQCVAAYHELVVGNELRPAATEKERDEFLSCIRRDLAVGLAKAFLEVESMAL